MDADFGIIASRWANEHRYASPSKLVRHLNLIGALTGVKGDKLKENSREMYDAAENVVGLGIRRWKD